jgi:hypothetical protein
MAKPKVYTYENRTFEVEVYGDEFGLLSIYVNEVIRQNRRFFGRTRVFTYDYVLIDRYPTIDEAVRKVIADGIKQEEYEKSINKKWKEWSEL